MSYKTHDEILVLISTGKALYGGRWQTELARAMGLSDARRIRQWISGDRPIPAEVWPELVKNLEVRKVIIESALADSKAILNQDAILPVGNKIINHQHHP